MDSKRKGKRNVTSPKAPTIIGTGLIALDVVIADSLQLEPLLCAGGTCGNVLAALAYLEWNAYPIARLRADAASKRVTDDLNEWGVRLDFIAIGDEGSTPVVVQHIRRSKSGEPSHSFSRKCPNCGTWLPWYKAVRAADVSTIATKLPDADVFYFDRTSRGAIEFARHAKESGSLVVFEPSTGSDPAMLVQALKAAHIVKIASDRLNGNEGVLSSSDPLLVIETRGADGLRYKHRGVGNSGRWKKVTAFKHSSVVDTAGAGDWCTAGIISRLGPLGVDGLRKATSQLIDSALSVGQAMAAWACQFHGARGGMYECSKQDFANAVKAILGGSSEHAETRKSQRGEMTTSTKMVYCNSCLGSERKKKTVAKERMKRPRSAQR